jgi:hypothetical protein
MNVARIASSITWSVPSAGRGVDPDTAQAQVNAQADTLSALSALSALMGTRHNTAVAAKISDGQGVDVHL